MTTWRTIRFPLPNQCDCGTPVFRIEPDSIRVNVGAFAEHRDRMRVVERHVLVVPVLNRVGVKAFRRNDRCNTGACETGRRLCERRRSLSGPISMDEDDARGPRFLR